MISSSTTSFSFDISFSGKTELKTISDYLINQLPEKTTLRSIGEVLLESIYQAHCEIIEKLKKGDDINKWVSQLKIFR